jgi:putative flavoprotein involved in K+ transport
MEYMKKKIVIVGAGPAGIGFGILLKQLGFKDFVILEQEEVGSSFKKWPKEMRLITPSFTGHGFGLLDLNAIAPDTSPAYTLEKEHLSGEEYASYLQILALHFTLPIHSYTKVRHVSKPNATFLIDTSEGQYEADILIWATGEFHFPNDCPFPGAEHGLHTSKVSSWTELEGDEYVVVGGYESGMDAAVNLAQAEKRVTVLSNGEAWRADSPDPSVSLSPYTKERLAAAYATKRLSLKGNAKVEKIVKQHNGYRLLLEDGSSLFTKTCPILATGFHSGAKQLGHLFEWGEEGKPLLTELDESTKVVNLFLVGPSVQHKNVIFCFIYKFRQRFAVIANEIFDRFHIDYDEKVFDYYRRNQMFLDDLSCCEVSCEC